MAGDAGSVRLGIWVPPVSAASPPLQLFLRISNCVPIAVGSLQCPSPGAAQLLGRVGEQHPPSLNLLDGDNGVCIRDASMSECLLGFPMELSAWIRPVGVSMHEDADDGLIVAGDGIRDALDPA